MGIYLILGGLEGGPHSDCVVSTIFLLLFLSVSAFSILLCIFFIFLGEFWEYCKKKSKIYSKGSSFSFNSACENGLSMVWFQGYTAVL